MKLKEIITETSMQVLDAPKAIELLKKNGIVAVRDTPVMHNGKEVPRVAVKDSETTVAADILMKSGNYFDPEMK